MFQIDTVVDNKFEIRSVIGHGGMGVVYEAYQRGLDRLVALKMLTIVEADAAEDAARFGREANILSRIQHPNIVQFFSYGVWCNTPYIAMERLHGDTLQKCLANNEPLDFEFALDVAEQICSALEHAHLHGVFHRDIKPSNLLLTEGANQRRLVKIIDFGLAKLVGVPGQQKLTQTGLAIGSVIYMSPEQCLGRTVDARTDIYAVGAILYHMLTGQPPFLADSAVALMFQHINGPVTATTRWNGIPQPFQLVLAKCMAKNPEQRYSSAAALKKDVELLRAQQPPLLEGKPAEAEVSDSGAKNAVLPERSKSRGRLLGIALAVAASLVGATLYFSKHHEIYDDAKSKTPYEVVHSLGMRQSSTSFKSASEVDELLAAIESYKRQSELDKPTLANAYEKLMNYFYDRSDWNRVRSLGRECLSVAGYPNINGVRFVCHYHDACEIANCQLSVMPVVLEGLRRYGQGNPLDLSAMEQALACDYLQLGKTHEAAVLIDRIDKRGNADVLLQSAQHYYVQNKFSQANPIWKRALGIAEKKSDKSAEETCLYMLGYNYYGQALHADSAAWFEKALATYPRPKNYSPALVHLHLGLCYKNQGKLDEAQRAYKLALAMAQTEKLSFGQESQILNTIANFYVERRQYKDAEPVLKRFIALNQEQSGPDLEVAEESLANIFQAQHRYAEAELMYKRALAFAENDVHGRGKGRHLYLLAYNYYEEGKYASAERLFEQALLAYKQENETPTIGCHFNLANCYRGEGRFADAEREYKMDLAQAEKISLTGPHMRNILNTFANFYSERGKHAEADQLRKRAAQTPLP